MVEIKGSLVVVDGNELSPREAIKFARSIRQAARAAWQAGKQERVAERMIRKQLQIESLRAKLEKLEKAAQ